MSKSPIIFNMVCFTTNNNTFCPLTVMRKFLINSGNNNKPEIKNNNLNFDFQLENKKYKISKILISIHQILNFEGGNFDLCSFADSYLIIIDLEKDRTYEQLDIIISFMNNYCDLEKMVFVMGVYNNAKNIKKELAEENIIEYLDEKKLTYEYVESNSESSQDLVKTIDFILKEGIKKVENKIIENSNNSKFDSQSKSKCFIF